MQNGVPQGAGNRSRYGVPLLNVMCQMPREWIVALDRVAKADDLSRADLLRSIIACWLIERDLITPPRVVSRARKE